MEYSLNEDLKGNFPMKISSKRMFFHSRDLSNTNTKQIFSHISPQGNFLSKEIPNNNIKPQDRSSLIYEPKARLLSKNITSYRGHFLLEEPKGGLPSGKTSLKEVL